jgi:hypothetical protein
MIPRPLPLTASLLAVAALAPAVASADVDLAGAPTLRVLDHQRVGLQIATDHRLSKRHGAINARISVNGRRLGRLHGTGRHGKDYLYAGTISRNGLEVGEKYTVRISIPGQKTIVRQVKLHPERT